MISFLNSIIIHSKTIDHMAQVMNKCDLLIDFKYLNQALLKKIYDLFIFIYFRCFKISVKLILMGAAIFVTFCHIFATFL